MKKTAQIFLCYVRQDEEKVSALYGKLSLADFHPFMDTKDILPGEDWKQVLMNTIREAPFFLACLSNNSVDKRGVIQEEIREALDVWRQKLDSDIYFIPVRLEDCRVPGTLTDFQWVDLFQDHGFDRLVRAIKAGMERLGIVRPFLAWDDVVNEMLQEMGFFDARWNKSGKGLRHKYKKIERHGHTLVIDYATGLTWQRSGSFKRYANIEKYISELNKQNFGGYNDWRLPTLEEAIALMEPKKHGELYINPVFDQEQKLIWTADKESAAMAWVVKFDEGTCARSGIYHSYFVRAVR